MNISHWFLRPDCCAWCLIASHFRSKAVADGALGFYCDHHVSARVSRFMYGVEYLREFDLNDPEHVARKERLCELPSGPQLLPDAFDCILARVGRPFPRFLPLFIVHCRV